MTAALLVAAVVYLAVLHALAFGGVLLLMGARRNRRRRIGLRDVDAAAKKAARIRARG